MRFRKPQSHASRIMRANAERDAGIPDRKASDNRLPFDLDLRHVGGRNLHIEPRLGYVAWRAIDAGEVVYCCALKELLHKIADDLPRMPSARTIEG